MAKSLTVLVLAVSLAAPFGARAELISTSQALAIEDAGAARSVVDSYLARDEVAAELVALGVDPELARLRAESLSGAELKDLAGRVAEAPAGGTGVIEVLGITFLVLLILELVGVIDIFNKV